MPGETGKSEAAKTHEDLSISRHSFINGVYPRLFGEDFTSDSTVEITSLNVTGLLMQYEAQLVKDGLIKLAKNNGQA